MWQTGRGLRRLADISPMRTGRLRSCGKRELTQSSCRRRGGKNAEVFRFIGKATAYVSLAGLTLGICVLDGVPESRLSLFLLVLVGLAGGIAAGAYIYKLGDR